MTRSGMSTIPDAIRIEDEVWQEAFATRVSTRRRDAEGVIRRERVIPLEPRTQPGPAPAPRPVAAAAPPAPGRRTVQIKGRGAERNLPPPRRSPRALHERAGFRPDRLAMWAVFLGLLLVLIALVSAH